MKADKEFLVSKKEMVGLWQRSSRIRQCRISLSSLISKETEHNQVELLK